MINGGSITGIVLLGLLTFFSGWMTFKYFHLNLIALTDDGAAIFGYLQQNALAKPLAYLKKGTQGTSSNGGDFSHCPIDYMVIPFGSFAGLYPGCSCPTGEIIVAANGVCPTECSFIPEIHETAINVWGQDLVLCGKFSQNIEYLTNTIANATCREGYRQCSKTVCVSAAEECPINGIAFVDPDSELANYTFADVAFTSLSGKAVAVAVRRGNASTDSSPITVFSTEINDPSCVSPSEHPFRNNQRVFPLEKAFHGGCQTFGRDSLTTISIDSQDEMRTYDNNNITSPNQFRTFVSKNNDIIKLVARTKLTFHDTVLCQQLDLKQVANIQNHIDVSITYLNLLGLVFLTFLLLAIVYEVFLLLSSQRQTHYVLGILTSVFIFLGCVTLFFNYLFVRDRLEKSQESVNKTLPRCQTVGIWSVALDDVYIETSEVIQGIFNITSLMAYIGIAVFAGGIIFTILNCRVKSSEGNATKHQELQEVPSAQDYNGPWLHEDSLNVSREI